MASPLTRLEVATGKVMNRPPEIEAEIDRALLETPQRLRERLAIRTPSEPGFLRAETLIHLIRQALRRNESGEEFFYVLNARCDATLKARLSITIPDVDELRQDILTDLATSLVEDIQTGGDAMDFFECKFNLAFRTMRIDHLEKHLLRHNRAVGLKPPDGEGEEQPLPKNTDPTYTRPAFADPETLEALIRLYPDHTAELTDFAISLALDPWSDDDEDDMIVDSVRANEGISAAASHAVSAYHNAVYKLRHGQEAGDIRAAAAVSIENPFLALDRKALRDVAARLDADVPFVIKLRDRVIDYATMTDGFVAAVSEVVPVALGLLETHLSSTQPVVPVGQHFKADDKPVMGRQQSFKEAVETSEMSERQRQRLLTL